MKKTRHFIIWVAFASAGFALAQNESRADRYYFEYAYRDAIKAYQQEMREYRLSPAQQLNLADAFFRTGQYQEAADTFMEVYKQDSLMTNAQFNTMLQALSKTSGPERAKAFFSTRSQQVSGALLENANFNYETLEDPSASLGNYRIFPLSINSRQSDFAPSFFGEDQLLFSSSRPLASKETYKPSGESYMDVYTTRVEPGGQATMPTRVSWIPPIPYHQATPYYSEALGVVFYVRSNMEAGMMAFDPNGKNALGICRAARDGSFRELLRDLGTSFYYPFFDSSSGKLYFAADFEKGYGGTDLYYVYTNNGQIMSEPVNLGPQINTPGNEIAPYIFEGSLYFASDIFYGLGGMDLYKADLQEGDFFSIPVNLGPEINTPEDEFGFIIRANPAGGYSGYFSSNRPGGMGGDDLYGFTVDEKPGMKTLVFRGTVQDPGGMAVEKAYVRLYGAGGTLLKEAWSREDGTFRLEIPYREGVSLQAGRDRYETVALGNTADQPDLASGKPLKVALTPLEAVVQLQADQALLRMERFYFDRGSTRITPAMGAILDQAAEALLKFPALRVRIEAHTDSRGSAATNLQLSQKRAEAIREYLLSKGVDPETIAEVAGYGEQQILNNCTDGVYCLDVLHKQNERYPLVVLNYNDL